MITDEHTDNLLKNGDHWIERVHLHLSREVGGRGVVICSQGQQADCYGDSDSESDQKAVA